MCCSYSGLSWPPNKVDGSFIGFEKEAEIVVAGRIGSILRRMEGDNCYDLIFRGKVLYLRSKNIDNEF